MTGWVAGHISWMRSLGLLMAFWIVASLAIDLWERVRPAGGVRAACCTGCAVCRGRWSA